ncbi:MAG: cytosol nonspecific dipeptidase [Bacteroidetes bacterium CG2_30_32_10]|nr:MAG: cytosol nonspecific dipeptidase [Bacteroidetes bacterium CG2_30_32_10]
MNSILNGLYPEKVWYYFEEICKYPRPSKKEEKIAAFIVSYGKSQGLETITDEIGNVLIRKPATKGKENLKTVILQSHIDMVCEKNSDTVHDFNKDPIQPFISGEWVKAKGTTLGADDGIGVAAQLAILESKTIEHGPIECLFTVDEETGLTGAFALKPGFLKGNILLNLDSEDEGQLYIGCAGGKDTVATFNYSTDIPSPNSIAYKIMVSGLKGGHSGDDINKGLANSNKLLNRLLWNCKQFGIRLSSIDGGNLRNAIPREAYAIITVAESSKASLLDFVKDYEKIIRNEYKTTELNIKITCESTKLPDTIIDSKITDNLLNALYACPHGVIAMTAEMPDLVETSTNLATIKMVEGNLIKVGTSQRSSVVSAKQDIVDMVASVFLLANARIQHGEGYPGWQPNLKSEILKTVKNSYLTLYKREPKVMAIHAGLECGLIGEKYPEMDMISFGPTLRGVHSPDEKLNIESVRKFWDLIVEVLKNIPKV